MKKGFFLCLFMAVCVSIIDMGAFASDEGYEELRGKIDYQATHSDDEGEGSALMGPGGHASFRLKHGGAHEGGPFDFEAALKSLDVFDQNLARAAVAVHSGCPNWSLLPMDTEAGRARAENVARILTDHYAHQKGLCAQETERHVWGLKATALRVSYGEAWTKGARAQEEAESSCCSLCCLFFC